MTVALIVCATLAVLSFLAAPIFLGRYVSDRIVHHEIHPRAHTWADGIGKGEFPADYFERNPFEPFSVEVPDVPGSPAGASISLKGMWLSGGDKADKTIVFLHGVSWTLHGDIKYADEFVRRGWNVVMVDSRGHGDSGGSFVTFGHRERHDVPLVVEAVRRRFPATRWLGLHGESMGAAIALQALPLLKDVAFVVADSSFSNLARLGRIQMSKVGVPRLLLGVVAFWCDVFTRLRAGFRFAEVAPAQALRQVKSPVLFIHGKEDEVTPWQMSVEMHELCKGRGLRTGLLVQEGALHTKSIIVNRARYMATMWSFIDEVVPSGEV